MANVDFEDVFYRVAEASVAGSLNFRHEGKAYECSVVRPGRDGAGAFLHEKKGGTPLQALHDLAAELGVLDGWELPAPQAHPFSAKR